MHQRDFGLEAALAGAVLCLLALGFVFGHETGRTMLAALMALSLALAFAIRTIRLRIAQSRRAIANALALADMGERLGNLGRWRFLPDGTQEWSEGMLRLTGFPSGCMPDEETRRELLVDGGASFYRAFEANARNRDPFDFEFAITRVDGQHRTLRVVAQNEFGDDDRLVQRFGVAIDVTDEREQLARLDAARGAALRQAEKAKALANTDPLTGLANRRHAMAVADRAVLSATRNGSSLALAVFDLDHFKSVNDTYGHAAGDAVLVAVARIARQQVRAADTLARIGGEEFLWLLEGADGLVAEAATERLRDAIAAGSAAGGAPAVTARIGYAVCRPGDSALALFARADAALYAAKHGGRKGVKMAA